MHTNRYFMVMMLIFMIGSLSSTRAGEPDDNQSLRDMVQSMQQKMAAQDAELTQVKTRLTGLESENAQLRTQLDDNWLSERRVEQTKALIRDVLSDAETRASLRDDGLTAGYTDAAFLASESGNFLLKFLGQLQLRYTLSTSDDARDDAAAKDLDDDRSGFEVTRFRMGFMGHVVDPTWNYYVLTGFKPDGATLILDAYIRKDVCDDLSITFGQFKTPLVHEFIVSTKRQQFVERSFMAQSLSGRYTQGIMPTWMRDNVKLMFALTDGLTQSNTAYSAEDVEGVAATGRAEWLVTGTWKQYKDFASWRGEQRMLVIGAAGHYQEGEYGTSGTTLTTGDEAEIVRWTADVALELGGANLYAAVVGNHQSESDNVPDFGQYSFLVQAGFFVTEELELVTRYEWGDFDLSGVEDLSVLTAGFNRYFARHRLKWQTDVAYSFNAMNRVSIGGNTFGWPVEFQGWRPDAAGSNGQVLVRSQLQMLF